MLKSKAIFLWISYQKKNMGYLHDILWKKCSVRKRWRNYRFDGTILGLRVYLRPNSKSLAGGYSWLWLRVVVPDRSAQSAKRMWLPFYFLIIFCSKILLFYILYNISVPPRSLETQYSSTSCQNLFHQPRSRPCYFPTLCKLSELHDDLSFYCTHSSKVSIPFLLAALLLLTSFKVKWLSSMFLRSIYPPAPTQVNLQAIGFTWTGIFVLFNHLTNYSTVNR